MVRLALIAAVAFVVVARAEDPHVASDEADPEDVSEGEVTTSRPTRAAVGLAGEIIVTEEEDAALLDAQDEPLRSTLHNGPLSQTVTELGGRPILSQAFDLGKAAANEPYRIVRRERLRLPTYVHDVIGGVTPQPIPSPYWPGAYGSPYAAGAYPGAYPYPYAYPGYPAYPYQQLPADVAATAVPVAATTVAPFRQ